MQKFLEGPFGDQKNFLPNLKHYPIMCGFFRKRNLNTIQMKKQLSSRTYPF